MGTEKRKLNPRVIRVDGKVKYLILDGFKFNRYELLAFAERVSEESIREARSVLRVASTLFHPEDDWAFNELYHSVSSSVAEKSFFRSSEFWLHHYFKENIKTIMGNDYETTEMKQSNKHRPDAWVRLGEQVLPVEIKKGKFGKRAMDQLVRYMTYYKTVGGVAVGTELTTKLPTGVVFYDCSSWGEVD